MKAKELKLFTKKKEENTIQPFFSSPPFPPPPFKRYAFITEIAIREWLQMGWFEIVFSSFANQKDRFCFFLVELREAQSEFHNDEKCVEFFLAKGLFSPWVWNLLLESFLGAEIHDHEDVGQEKIMQGLIRSLSFPSLDN